MKKQWVFLLLLLGSAIPALAQHRQPVATAMFADGKMEYIDYRVADLLAPEPQHVNIQKVTVFDFQCVSTQPAPPPGNARFYCDSATNQMVCITSTGASCLGGGGGGGGGSVTSVGLLGPTGIVISNSPVTGVGTLTWSMPTGWILGDLLSGNGSNSVARLAAPTTPDDTPQILTSTPASGVGQQGAWALAGLAGRVVSGTTDTILATDRAPKTIEYTSNSPTAITVPEPASAGFTANPTFVTVAEGIGPYTFTPAATAVITYCSGGICFAGQPSLTLTQGQYATWSSPSTSNWLVRVSGAGPGTTPICTGSEVLTGGGVVWTGLLNFTVSPTNYCISGTTYTSPQTNLTLSAADPTNPRIDVIAVNDAGAAVVITGTPAGSPAAPTVDPASQLLLTFVTVPAASPTPSISSITVYDESSTPPTEWTPTSTAAFNFASTNNPYHLTHDVEVTGAINTGNVVFTNSAPISLATYNSVSFYIRNKAVWANSVSLQICFLNGTTVVGTCIGFKNGVFGFDQSNTTSYQQIVIPLANMSLASQSVNKLRFQVTAATGASVGFYLDWVQIQSIVSGSSNQFQLQVNSSATQSKANLKDSASVTFTAAQNGVTTDITATAIGAPPSGSAGGALAGTYPNPTLANGTSCTNQVVTAISQSTAAGTCSSVANAMLTNSATTVNGQTCTLGSTCNVNTGSTAHTVAVNEGNGAALASAGPGTAGQVFRSAGSGADPAYSDFPDVKLIPAANCPNGTPGSGWSYATSTFTAACRAGSNNLGGALQLAPSGGAAAQFRIQLPLDWDTASQPYIRIEYGSGANTSGTVIWTVASACTKADGSVTDDPSFNAESAFGTQTMAAASRAWSQTGQFTAITSGNNCVPGGGLIIKATLSGTASSAINVYQAVVTTPRLITVQAN